MARYVRGSQVHEVISPKCPASIYPVSLGSLMYNNEQKIDVLEENLKPFLESKYIPIPAARTCKKTETTKPMSKLLKNKKITLGK